jgi:branched-chain amino acid transport system permease protein
MMDQAVETSRKVLSPPADFGTKAEVARLLAAPGRWSLGETAFWAAAFGAYAAFPSYHPIINEIAILGLFALSLDLILGYAGIVSLGHAAFLGLGAYTAGILARDVAGDPLLGLAAAALASAMLGWATSFLLLRGNDLSRLMVTLGVALVLYELANTLSFLTGGADGLQGMTVAPLFGVFAFDLFGRTAAAYSLVSLFLLFLLARRIVTSPFGRSLQAIRENRIRAAAVGVPVNSRLRAVYTLAAVYAGVAGALLAQTTQFVSLDILDFHRSADILLVLIIGGTGFLYGGLIGAIVFKLMQDQLATATPQYWQFWVGLILVVFVLVGRERLGSMTRDAAAAVASRVCGMIRR